MARTLAATGSLFLVLGSFGTVHAQPTSKSAAQWREQRAKPEYAAKEKQTLESLNTALKAKQDVGTPIPNFAPEFRWDRKADEVRLAVYINSGDLYGVCISNLKKGDRVYVTSANGVCRFSRGDALSKVVSLVGVVGTVTAGVFAPEAAPFIPTVEGWVQKNLIPANKGEQRDAYGQDPDTRDFCQDEGGVIICTPSSGGVLYRGGRNGSIPRKQPRTDDNLPDHVKGRAFFLVRGNTAHNTRAMEQDGELFLAAWDSAGAFGDNTGAYVLRLTITRADKVQEKSVLSPFNKRADAVELVLEPGNQGSILRTGAADHPLFAEGDEGAMGFVAVGGKPKASATTWVLEVTGGPRAGNDWMTAKIRTKDGDRYLVVEGDELKAGMGKEKGTEFVLFLTEKPVPGRAVFVMRTAAGDRWIGRKTLP
jgi:hypothetical protein